MALGTWRICFYLYFLFYFSTLSGPSHAQLNLNLTVDASKPGLSIPSTLFGIFLEEINHAGAGGLWAELVSNRGFEAGGQSTPSKIDPWSIIGDDHSVRIATEWFSPFEHNPVSLQVKVLCDSCPENGVGVYNPGYWGMNILAGSTYNVVFWAASIGPINVSIALRSSDGEKILSQSYTILGVENAPRTWSKYTLALIPFDTDHYGRLSITARDKGVFWLDQVSVMPADTYKGHGFRKDLAFMLDNLKPRFIRFPGGCYVEGEKLQNAFSWNKTIGPWQERPGHYGDVWGYWTDDGLGFFEFLQLAEDLEATPIWVFNNGISHKEEIPTSEINAYVEDVLNGIEFAKGPANSEWGSVRSSMGHTDPFPLKYVAVGNEDCGKHYYKDNYMKFYDAIKSKHPDMLIISNCDGTSQELDHPADLYDVHVYDSASSVFKMTHHFDNARRGGPKAFVSEYAVWKKDAGKGSLYAALGEAGFLIGIEKNSDVVEMASYAPLLVNNNDRRWNPDAIVFDSWQSYGTPSYWTQTFFTNSSGAELLPSFLNMDNGTVSDVVASVIRRTGNANNIEFLDVKVVNIGKTSTILQLTVEGLSGDLSKEATIIQLTSQDLMDENSFDQSQKVIPKMDMLYNVSTSFNVPIPAWSFNMITLRVSKQLGDTIEYDVQAMYN